MEVRSDLSDAVEIEAIGEDDLCRADGGRLPTAVEPKMGAPWIGVAAIGAAEEARGEFGRGVEVAGVRPCRETAVLELPPDGRREPPR